MAPNVTSSSGISLKRHRGLLFRFDRVGARLREKTQLDLVLVTANDHHLRLLSIRVCYPCGWFALFCFRLRNHPLLLRFFVVVYQDGFQDDGGTPSATAIREPAKNHPNFVTNFGFNFAACEDVGRWGSKYPQHIRRQVQAQVPPEVGRVEQVAEQPGPLGRRLRPHPEPYARTPTRGIYHRPAQRAKRSWHIDSPFANSYSSQTHLSIFLLAIFDPSLMYLSIYLCTYCLCVVRSVQCSVLSCCLEEPEAPQLVADAQNAVHGLVDAQVGRDKSQRDRWPVHGSFLGSALRRSWSRSVLLRRHSQISIYSFFIYLSIIPFTYVSICHYLSFLLSIYLLSSYLAINLSIYLSIYIPTYLCVSWVLDESLYLPFSGSNSPHNLPCQACNWLASRPLPGGVATPPSAWARPVTSPTWVFCFPTFPVPGESLCLFACEALSKNLAVSLSTSPSLCTICAEHRLLSKLGCNGALNFFDSFRSTSPTGTSSAGQALK